jgi:GrpB-like predicted nucleotidyltransferase (UPF0157 family)
MNDGDRPAESYTDEEIAAMTIGEPARIDGEIQLLEWDPAWAGLFTREAARIRAALGDRVRVLEHVGSTSVPGLMAKPIIDIVLAVADSVDEASYVPALEAVGYVLHLREPDWFEHRLLKGTDPAVNLHVFTEGTDEIGRMIAFRDYLRSHPDDLVVYAEAKRELAARHWKYVQNYADAKTTVIDEIMARAAGTARTEP